MCILDRDTREMLRATEPPDNPHYREVVMELRPGTGAWREPALNWKVVMRLYDATSFMTWRYGICFDTHLNIGFGLLGLDDRAAAELMPVFNKEMKRWLAQNCRSRRGPNRSRGGASYHYVYVLEYGRNRGLHAHLLCNVPTYLKEAYEAHVRQWWARAAKLSSACSRCTFPWQPLPQHPGLRPRSKAARELCPGMPGVHGCKRHDTDTVGIKMPERAICLKHRSSSSPQLAHRRQGYWLRYILKSMKPEEKGWVDVSGTYSPLEAVLRIPLRGRPKPEAGYLPNGVCVSQLYGISHTLSEATQRREGFQSKLRLGLIDEVFSAWELEAFALNQTMKTLFI